MDKPTENNVVLNYECGWRAYDIHDTTQKLFQNVLTGNTYWLLSDEDHTDWHALRAYQDEQRKKGVPIRIRGYDEAEKWRDNHRKSDVRPPFFFGSYAENPDLNEYSCDIPYIKHYAHDGTDLGFFTNFRWRAGYTKPAKSDHCGGASCPFEYSCVDGCMYPKGGQNG